MSDSTPTLQQTKEIPLTRGKVAIVDAADYEWLMQWKWCIVASKNSNTFYARRATYENGKQRIISMHRQILGAQPGIQVDHRDDNGLNNTRDNLRLATNQQNIYHQPVRIDNTSGYKGVSFFKEAGKWMAYINAGGKRTYLGLFATAELAARAYDKAARELHGEFARPNLEE